MITKILLGIFAGLVFLGLGLFTTYSMQPAEFVVERSVVIDASPQEVFSTLRTFEPGSVGIPGPAPV